ncbi:MAG: hypothetical protein FWD79_05625 [Desulfobulbus sp.]|nr:hypothetical protein [Desulfobulbus sp.]
MNETNLTIAVLSLLREMGGWGIDVVLVCALIVPPLLGFMSMVLGVRTIRSLEGVMIKGMARVEAITREMGVRYDNNVLLVKDHQQLVRNYQAMTDGVLDVIKENTKTITLATARMEGLQGRRWNAES